MTDYLLILLSCFAVFYAFLYTRISRDVDKLFYSLRHSTKPSYFHTSLIRRLWSYLQLKISNRGEVDGIKQTYTEAIELTRSLALVSTERTLSADTFCSFLRGLSSDISAVAIVLQNSPNGEYEIEKVNGLSPERIKAPVLALFDRVAQQSSWGYSTQDNYSNFSTFGIGDSLLVPLEGTQGLIGGAWLGFRTGTSTLTPERKVLLDAVAKHASASFYSAQMASDKFIQSRNERDVVLGISHDIRSPGTTALYAVRSLLEENDIGSSQRKDLEKVERALKEQLNLLSDLFDFSKFQNGTLVSSPSTFNLSNSLSPLFDDFDALASEKRLELIVDSIPAVDISFDQTQFKRIIRNLLSNAIKYTEEGHIKVSFNIQDSCVGISISDTGIGLPNNLEAKELFQKFRRFSNAHGKPGTGLGLSVSKAMADLNKAVLAYEPNYPLGSVFSLTSLKCVSALKESVLYENILVADDDPGVRRTLSRYVRSNSKRIHCSDSIAETRQALKDNLVDLLITDMYFQDGTAAELLEDTELYCPAILCTGSEEHLSKPQSALCRAVAKPVDKEDLLAAMQDLRSKR